MNLLTVANRIGAMQPYLFPYIGYFQLISAVDTFVLLDDVQYTKRSWITRNRVLINGQVQYIIFPLKKSDYLKRINERMLSEDFPSHRESLLKTLSQVYARAPYFKVAFPVIEKAVTQEETNLAIYAENSLREICRYLGIQTSFVRSSDLGIDSAPDAQSRIIETVNRLGGKIYINPIGGNFLYDFDDFKCRGIALKFLQTDDIFYHQYSNDFVPSLSIIDVMMFNNVEQIRELLPCYSLNSNHDFAFG